MTTREFNCGNATYNIDQCMNGQTPLTYYDALAQVALNRSLREDTILCYNSTGVEGLLSQLQSSLGADERTVKANPFYWSEICSDFVITTSIKKSTGGVPAGGVAVTVNIDTKSMSTNGNYSIPRAGYRAYIKELNGQAVNIIAVDKSVSGAHTMTLKPINGEVLNLTLYPTFTLLVDTLRMYVKGDQNCITTKGMVQNPPALRKGYVQKYEDGYCINEDELDGYAYDVEFRIHKGIDPLTGKAVDMWDVPHIQNKLLTDLTDSKIMNTLFNQRDDAAQQGFNGLVPVAEGEGMFSRRYDPSSGVSLKAHIFSMIKGLRKAEGCNDYMLIHDFNFGMDWSDAIAALISAKGQNHVYSLFGTGGTGVRDFSWYQFKDFSAYNYNFRAYQMEMFDAKRYGNFLENFAIMMPACKFKDTAGKTVSPVTYVNIQAAQQASQNKIWPFSWIPQGCRKVDVFVKHAYGLEIHCASKLGVMRKSAC